MTRARSTSLEQAEAVLSAEELLWRHAPPPRLVVALESLRTHSPVALMSRAAKTESEMPRSSDQSSIILLERFIQATRDAGYKGTPSALAELVDNALQAGATRISIDIITTPDKQLEVGIMDNGCGMDRRALRQALRFGGSSRFNDRSSLGRYGMGLPNASLSQAQRVEVYTWSSSARPWRVHLDLHEIAAGRSAQVPEPRRAALPKAFERHRPRYGTLVLWRKCDRLDNRRASTITRKLIPILGRVFRYFLFDGVKIHVNGQEVQPVDPLLIDPRSGLSGAAAFGQPTEYELRPERDEDMPVGKVIVSFSELPVHEWCDLSNEEKSSKGITKGAGVSIVRAGREIDYGWFFMGSKRRENYDDWWRCEVRFEPVLDEAFGITFTKQQVHPRTDILRMIASDIEATARALNARVRQAHIEARTRRSLRATERLATELEQHLPRLPQRAIRSGKARVDRIIDQHPEVRAQLRVDRSGLMKHAIIHEELAQGSFFEHETDGDRFVLRVNTAHPFYRKLYRPLLDEGKQPELARQLELLVLSTARHQASARGTADARALRKANEGWSKILALYLNA